MSGTTFPFLFHSLIFEEPSILLDQVKKNGFSNDVWTNIFLSNHPFPPRKPYSEMQSAANLKLPAIPEQPHFQLKALSFSMLT